MPTEDKATRKLSAILSADVKGYSILMADDEAHTIQTLKAYRRIIKELISEYSGRVVDAPGDNILAEFKSAVNAVECSVKIQKKLDQENSKFVEEKKVQFRIGVNIGDVVQDGDRIYGNGVNVAARIEGLADPGGVCISRNAFDHIKSKLTLGYEYIGEHAVKNIKDPVMAEWAEENQVKLEFIQPGKPTQNFYIERFNRTYREEVLDLYLFSLLSEVRDITDEWIEQYNRERPYESLKNLTPVEYLTANSPEVSTFEWH